MNLKILRSLIVILEDVYPFLNVPTWVTYVPLAIFDNDMQGAQTRPKRQNKRKPRWPFFYFIRYFNILGYEFIIIKYNYKNEHENLPYRQQKFQVYNDVVLYLSKVVVTAVTGLSGKTDKW